MAAEPKYKTPITLIGRVEKAAPFAFSYLSSVFSMMASRKHGSLAPFWQLKRLLFDKNSTDKFTIREIGRKAGGREKNSVRVDAPQCRSESAVRRGSATRFIMQRCIMGNPGLRWRGRGRR